MCVWVVLCWLQQLSCWLTVGVDSLYWLWESKKFNWQEQHNKTLSVISAISQRNWRPLADNSPRDESFPLRMSVGIIFLHLVTGGTIVLAGLSPTRATWMSHTRYHSWHVCDLRKQRSKSVGCVMYNQFWGKIDFLCFLGHFEICALLPFKFSCMLLPWATGGTLQTGPWVSGECCPCEALGICGSFPCVCVF